MKNKLSSLLDICVLIPCHNNLGGLINSLKSISYDCRRLLVVVVDDGSSIAVTHTAIDENLPGSLQIEIIRLEKNLGITRALNTGLDYIYGNYNVDFVARLDCGDICTPERFSNQLAFFRTNPATDLLGTWCYFKDFETNFSYKYVTPAAHKDIKRSMYFRNVFVHPTVMWRVASLKEYRYPLLYPHAEDYGLFYDILTSRKTAIIEEFLVTCEINKKGISLQNRKVQLKSRLRVIWHFGENKFLLLAGCIKLGVLMAVPYKFIFRIKKILYSSKPGSMKPTKITSL